MKKRLHSQIESYKQLVPAAIHEFLSLNFAAIPVPKFPQKRKHHRSPIPARAQLTSTRSQSIVPPNGIQQHSLSQRSCASETAPIPPKSRSGKKLHIKKAPKPTTSLSFHIHSPVETLRVFIIRTHTHLLTRESQDGNLS